MFIQHVAGRRLMCMASLLCLLTAGCGEMKVAPVTGTVTLDGKPLANASVRFQPTGGGRPSAGFTDEDGVYVLDYSMTEAGAEVGSCQVIIATGGGGDYDESGQVTKQQTKNQIPAKYAKDPVVVEVEP